VCVYEAASARALFCSAVLGRLQSAHFPEEERLSECEPSPTTTPQVCKTIFNVRQLLEEMLFFISMYLMTAHPQVVCDSGTSKKIIRII